MMNTHGHQFLFEPDDIVSNEGESFDFLKTLGINFVILKLFKGEIAFEQSYDSSETNNNIITNGQESTNQIISTKETQFNNIKENDNENKHLGNNEL